MGIPTRSKWVFPFFISHAKVYRAPLDTVMESYYN
jgi:hypothetical protein